MKNKWLRCLLSAAIWFTGDIVMEWLFPEKGFTLRFWIHSIVAAILWTLPIYFWTRNDANAKPATTETYKQIQERKKLAAQQQQ